MKKQTSLKAAIVSFIAFTFAVSMVALAITKGTGASLAITAPVTFFAGIIVVFALAFNKMKYGNHYSDVMKAGVEVEIWANYIIERLWKDNTFFQFMFSDDDKVLAGKVVHIPQPGAKPTVVKNRDVFPATAVRRADTDIVYVLDEFTTDPTHIQDAEKVELSYDKIDSVYGDHAGQLVEDVAGEAIVRYITGLPTTQVIKTTGNSTAEPPTDATGNRKKLTVADFKKAQTIMNKQGIPRNDRYALLDSEMYSNLLDDLSVTQQRDFSASQDVENGVVGKLYGFTVLERSLVATAKWNAGAAEVNPYGAIADAADCAVSMFWQKNAIARALGEVKFFENPDRVEYYGDVYSALIRFGGRRRRADNYGVVIAVQDAA